MILESEQEGNKAIGVMKAGQTFTIEPMINAGGSLSGSQFHVIPPLDVLSSTFYRNLVAKALGETGCGLIDWTAVTA